MASYTQKHYRWKADDQGADTPSSWLTPLDTAFAGMTKGRVVRLRIQLQVVDPIAPWLEGKAKLQFRKVGDPGFTDVAIGEAWEPVASDLVADKTAATSALLGDPGGIWVWIDGQVLTTSVLSDEIAFVESESQFVEFEWCLRVGASAEDEVSYEFRIAEESGAVPTCEVYPTIAVLADPVDWHLLSALREKLRSPRTRVLVEWASVDYDVTDDVVSWDFSRDLNGGLGEGTIVLQNKDGKYDPLGGASGDFLTDPAIWKIDAGFRVGGTNYFVRRFTGKVSFGRARYSRGDTPTVSIPLLDRGKRCARQKVTTEKIEDDTQKVVFRALLVDEGKFADGDLLDAGTAAWDDADHEITCQFEQEYLLEALNKVAQAGRRHFYFDADGKALTRDFLADLSPQSDWDLPLIETESLEIEPSDPSATVVQVSGRDLLPIKIVGGREDFAQRRGVTYPASIPGWLKTMNAFEAIPQSGDISYKDYEVESAEDTSSVLDRVTIGWPGDTNLIGYVAKATVDAWLTSDFTLGEPPADEKTLGVKLSVVFKKKNPPDANPSWPAPPPGAAGTIGWNVSGSVIKTVVPYVWTEARNRDDVDVYGEVVRNLENPLIWQKQDAQEVADYELAVIEWSKRRVAISLASGNPALDLGSLVTGWHKRLGIRVWALVWGMKESFSRQGGYRSTLGCVKVGA